ncbi:alpha/beta fold hydrolase [Halomonas stenophila]|uniref:Pimeloyl-ACP methyl ester carboxylesterase n=1 Tax=Halomonas stenophila TaxID=795312 RepID=A0A7W5ETS8_9GAMM|nr:alpha/beta hydrolase [Halomonas stenophila]MBB3230536.1 pimeloyl-ACP methyl ester carboxylesterase [Halomonas stenophila]
MTPRTMTPRQLRLDAGPQAYHESGAGPAIVLLHGISSGAASWAPLALHLAGYRLLAWDAPGYGDSQPLAAAEPTAADYAARLDAWLDALGIERCVLVGHSLGAMMASAYAARRPEQLTGVILADPALGYRDADEAKRDEVYRSRWTRLAEQGHEAYAAARAPRLLRDDADPGDVARVREGMRRLHVEGFAQASWMLAHDALEAYAPAGLPVPATVLCGDADAITPPEASRALAGRLGLPYRGIARAGHASYIDAPEAFAAAVAAFAEPLLTPSTRTRKRTTP